MKSVDLQDKIVIHNEKVYRSLSFARAIDEMSTLLSTLFRWFLEKANVRVSFGATRWVAS